MRRRLALLILPFLLLSCRDELTAPAAKEGASDPALEISDAARNEGTTGFYFLTPVAPNLASYPGAFDATRSPLVEVCRWTGTACEGEPVGDYGLEEGTDGVVIRAFADQQYYRLDWPIEGLTPGQVYRIRVFLGGRELGHADAKKPATGETVTQVKAQGYVPLGNSRILPVRFRLEENVGVAAPDVVLADEVRALLTSGDPASTAENLLHELLALYATDPKHAHDRWNAVLSAAIDPVENADAVRRLNLALGNRMFDLGALSSTSGAGIEPAASFSRLPQVSMDAGPLPAESKTTVIFVNGINNSVLDAAEGAVEVDSLVHHELGWRFTGPEAKYALKYFYNPSAAYTPNPSLTCWAADLMRGPPSLAMVPGYALAIAANCQTDLGVLSDLGEAAVQVIHSIWFIPGLTNRTAEELALKVGDERRLGNKVLLVGHSQGNLMIEEAMKLLPDRSCIAVVSVAAPMSAAWPEDVWRRGIITNGKSSRDILTFLPTEDEPTIETALSRQYDSMAPSVARDLELHAFHNYITDPLAGRDSIRSLLKQASEHLDASCSGGSLYGVEYDNLPDGGSAEYLTRINLMTGESTRLYSLGDSLEFAQTVSLFNPSTDEYVHETYVETSGYRGPYLQAINVQTGAIRKIDLPGEQSSLLAGAFDREHGVLYGILEQRDTDWSDNLARVDLKTGEVSISYPIQTDPGWPGVEAVFSPATNEYVYQVWVPALPGTCGGELYLAAMNVETGRIRRFDVPFPFTSLGLDRNHGILYGTVREPLDPYCSTESVRLAKMDLMTGQYSPLLPLGTNVGTESGLFDALTSEHVHTVWPPPSSSGEPGEPYLQLVNVQTGGIRTIDLPGGPYDWLADWGG